MKKIEAFLNRLFSPDGSFMDFLTQVADVLLAGVLWLVCSIPVVTIGASTAAMYQVLLNVLDGREDGVLRDFFGAFRHRFGFYTKLWLVFLALGLFFGLDLYFYYLWSAAGSWMGVVLFGLFAAATVIYLCTMLYVFPYALRRELPLLATVKNAFYIGMRHLPVTLLILAINIGLIVLCLNFAVLFVALPGVMGWADALCMRRLLNRYAPPPSEGEA